MKIHYQLSTTNLAFVRMYKTLKDAGIANNKFFLRIFDVGLMNIDPFDETLSDEMRGRVLAEIIRNPWYFYREIALLPVPGGTVRFNLHLGNLAILWCIHNNRHYGVMLPRQRGKTMSSITAFVWIYYFGTKNTNVVFGNKQLDDAQLNLKRFVDVANLLPEYLKFKHPKDISNVKRIFSTLRSNEIKVIGCSTDDEGADKSGRGLTVPVILLDEFAFLKFNSSMYKSASPAQMQAAAEAEKQGSPHFKAILTTPSMIETESGKFCKQLFDNSASFTLELYDWDKTEIDHYIDSNSTNDFLYIEYSYTELGLSKQWYRQQCRALENDLLRIRREILLQWTKSSDVSIFSEQVIMDLESSILPYSGKIFILDVYKFLFVRQFSLKKKYLVGVDVAGGLAKDFSTIVISDIDSLEPIGYFENNKINSEELYSVLEEFILAYFTDSVLIVERNSYGLPLINKILKEGTISKNLFFHYKEASGKRKEGTVLAKTSHREKIYGIDTTTTSRNIMMDILQSEVVNNREIFVLKRIVEQISTLVRTNRGKIEHDSGCHDDVLFAYLVSRYAFIQPTMPHFLQVTKLDQRTVKEFSMYNTGEQDRIATPSDFQKKSQMATTKISPITSILDLNNL